MVFIVVALLGIAAVLVYLAGERLELRRLSHESLDWPRARGEVIGGRTAWSASPRSGKSYWPTIDYRYSVGGTTFQGNRVSFRSSYRRSETEAAFARYPIGSAVSVWYRPGAAEESVLEPNTWRGGLATDLLVSITSAMTLLALIALAVLLLVSRPRA